MARPSLKKKKMGRGDNPVFKHLGHKHEDLVQISRAQGNARWVWWPSCNSSLRRQRLRILSKLTSKTGCISKLWVRLRDPASMDKEERTMEQFLIPTSDLHRRTCAHAHPTQPCPPHIKTSRGSGGQKIVRIRSCRTASDTASSRPSWIT